MAEAGHGRILGVTSGSGWRAADAGGYSAAKRAVAALTWQLGRVAPPGVTVNALSPIANTRMVAAAFERARAAGRAGGGGGLTLDAIPGPENLGPLGAYLVGDECGWCSGQVLFAGGPEVAVVDQPRLVEVVRTDDVVSLAGVLEAVVPRAFVAAEANQATDGGANPRFGSIFDEPGAGGRSSRETCGPVPSSASVPIWPPPSPRHSRRGRSPATATEPARGLRRRGQGTARHGGRGRADRRRRGRSGRASPPAPLPRPTGWQGVLADHRGLVEHLHADASWTRAVAEYAARTERPVRTRHADRRHDAGGPEPGAGLGAARPGRRRRHGSPRHRAGGERGVVRAGRGRDDGRAGRASSRSPGGRRPRRCGAGRGDRVDRPAQPTRGRSAPSSTAGPRSPGGWTAPPPDRRCPRPEPAGGGPMTDASPPASSTRTSTCGIRHGPTGTRTCRVPGRRAAARAIGARGCTGGSTPTPTGPSRHGGTSRSSSTSPRPPDPTPSTRPSSSIATRRDQRRPRRHRRRTPTDRDGGGGGRPARPPDGGVALPRRPSHGTPGRPGPRRRVLGELRDRSCLRIDGASRPAGRGGRRLAGFPDLTVVVEHTGWPRTNSDEERALWQTGLYALAALGDHVVCKLSGLAMPLGPCRSTPSRRGSSTPSMSSGPTGACSPATSPSTAMAGTFDDLYTGVRRGHVGTRRRLA